ncbi:MAG: methylmalonyl-CoA mutase family protein, partial [Acidobacteria bacterium]|nr:methylmalonyl-CoA mutase family protein [Acidobacteriota bacterium]
MAVASLPGTAPGKLNEEGVYVPSRKVRFVTAASLFDGHDASINIIRRLLQASGAEVIHLGHNRSVREIVDTALQEDAQGIAVSSYQGGHLEFFRYMLDLLREAGAGHIQVFGGGGGVIVPEEIRDLESAGVARIYSPEDGRLMGLQGMINDMLARADFDPREKGCGHPLARRITELELEEGSFVPSPEPSRRVPVLGITGTGGAGKSSLTDELVRRFFQDLPDHRVAVLSVDPSKRKTGGALLGDRIRMNAIFLPEFRERVFMRSLATRAAHRATSASLRAAIRECKAAGYDLVVVETAGIGQSDSEITDLVDVALYVMTPEYGAATQLEKIDMLDFADLVILNKGDKRGAEDALRDVRKQFQRGHRLFDSAPESLPVFLTIASQFNDPGTDLAYGRLLEVLVQKTGVTWEPRPRVQVSQAGRPSVIPGERVRYLAEIADTVQGYKKWAARQADTAELAYAFYTSLEALGDHVPPPGEPYDAARLSGPAEEGTDPSVLILRQRYQEHLAELHPESRRLLASWGRTCHAFRDPENVYVVRGREIRAANYTETLSGTRLPKVALPRTRAWGDLLRWQLLENTPGRYPFTAGVFEYKRAGEDPTRMFAGEGTPERTNKRFHYVSKGQPAVRLSTAFDSVTLYGEDPHPRPDIYGKVGNSGVSICTVDDAKKLYSGFDLLAPTTSVSMTINGPAPAMLAFFLNAVVDQRAEAWLREQGRLEGAVRDLETRYRTRGHALPRYEGELPPGHTGLGLALLGASASELLPPDTYQQLRGDALCQVRGTVQADILKEDQAQNTCIFSAEFALRVMGDVQESFIRQRVRNFYSVSISGYHIAEAGANPITQLAFTLANGFTYVEYYLSRGMDIDAFAPNLSFFFSNGLDAEYSVLGRVARRIWATAMKEKYGANERSQKLKYHIQTSGRSLHAQEIDFNDIRTTLQALSAVYDNCNSLHTNAYDEAITTPTEESVRRAMAIQLIINRELGTARNENPLQGSFIIEELTELVEEAVLLEFRRLTDRGGVLGAMETMYQRGKIQEESLFYEHRKHSGELPIIGVNTFLNPRPAELTAPELIRSSEAEKAQQIRNLQAFHARNAEQAPMALLRLQDAARAGCNIFDELLESARVCSLGQISQALYEVGGQYRRSM